MTDLDQSPAQPYDLIARGPTEGLVKDYTLGGGGGVPGGSNKQIQFNSSGTFNGDGAFIWSVATTTLINTGRELMGISTPVSIAATDSRVQIADDGLNWHQSYLGYGGGGNGPALAYAHSRAASPGSQTALQDGDFITTYDFYGSDGTDYRRGARIGIAVDGTPSAGSVPARVSIYTTPAGSGPPVERTRTNNVGFTQLTNGSLGRAAPVTKTADFTVATSENWLINNKAGSTCTVTLPTAASFSGREIMFNNYQAQTVVSASANVVQQTGATTTSAILAATAGKWATLVSNGTNWVIMQSGG